MKFGLLLLAATSVVGAQSAPRVASTLPVAELEVLEQVRRDVWANWFSGDTAALRRVLGPELVAISPDAEHWQTLDETLTASARFKASGSHLAAVKFDSTTVHRFGEVVVMFSHYVLLIEGKEGRSTQRGRATEVFVRSAGRWVHTSWQLDKFG